MTDLDRLLTDAYRNVPIPEAVAFETAVTRKRRVHASERVRRIMRIYWAIAAALIAALLYVTVSPSPQWWLVAGAVVVLTVLRPVRIIRRTLSS